MTVKELLDEIQMMVASGAITEDTKIVISNDEEGNGFHLAHYSEGYEQKPDDILEGCEQVKEALIIG